MQLCLKTIAQNLTQSPWLDELIGPQVNLSQIKNINSRFEATSMWLLKPKAMDNKIQLLKIICTINTNKINEKDYTLDDQVTHSQ